MRKIEQKGLRNMKTKEAVRHLSEIRSTISSRTKQEAIDIAIETLKCHRADCTCSDTNCEVFGCYPECYNGWDYACCQDEDGNPYS